MGTPRQPRRKALKEVQTLSQSIAEGRASFDKSAKADLSSRDATQERTMATLKQALVEFDKTYIPKQNSQTDNPFNN